MLPILTQMRYNIGSIFDRKRIYMKILIVEDEDMIREGISDYLSDCGYETIQAADGLEP